MGDETGEKIGENSEDFKVEWENAKGVPSVVQDNQAMEYTTPDMADGDKSRFRPNLGCKCNDWRPAPSHPEIRIKQDFLEGNEGIVDKIAKLKVRMEDTTEDPPVLHWDATYDMQRFRGGD